MSAKHYTASSFPGMLLLTRCVTCGLADAPATQPKRGPVSDKCDKCRKEGKRTSREMAKAAKIRESQKTASLYVPEGNDLVIPVGEIDDFKPDPKGKLLSEDEGVKRWGFECWECGKQFVKRQAEGQRKPRARKYCSAACKQKVAERTLNDRIAAGDEAAMDTKYEKQRRYRLKQTWLDLRRVYWNTLAFGPKFKTESVSLHYTRNQQEANFSHKRSQNMGGRVESIGTYNQKWIQRGDPEDALFTRPVPCKVCGKPVEIDLTPGRRIDFNLIRVHTHCKSEPKRIK